MTTPVIELTPMVSAGLMRFQGFNSPVATRSFETSLDDCTFDRRCWTYSHSPSRLQRMGASGAKPIAVFRDYQFLPNTMHARANVSIHIYNDDVIAHTIVDDVPGFVSSMIKPGGSIELRFGIPPGNQPFTWNFHCNVHNEKGAIIVDPAGQ